MKRRSPPLPDLLRELRLSAERSGVDASLTLSHKARVAWRVRNGELIFAVSRPGVRVGDGELVIFKAAAEVPPHAVQIPAEGQQQLTLDGAVWYRVAWKWKGTPEA